MAIKKIECDEKVTNFNQMIEEIGKDVENEMSAEEKVADELFNEKAKVKQGIMSRIWQSVLMKLLGSFKVKITLYYNDKVVFEYTIPKN